MTENTNEDAIEENVNDTEVTEGANEGEATLSLNDLKTMFQVIQVCSKRAAFGPEEYETVGALYSKLYRFLLASGAITVEAPADGVEAAADAEETDEEASQDAE